ncbi:uncharacterized protein LOC117152511 [Bombus impatiens]|uniref:Uncharacterized protein LOC117152511 n=1 Tax=Bombus impatiens TaxID=132113 RepID=A0A6P8LMU1_BOMIM|nr:uncharacterized protein LOC117152511 [Bombus impatiens]
MVTLSSFDLSAIRLIRVAACGYCLENAGGVEGATYPPDSPYFPFGSRGVPPSVGTPTPAANPAAPTGSNGARLPNSTAGAAAVKRKKDALDGADGEVVTTQHWVSDSKKIR